MGVITDIQRQKKQDTRVNVFVDGQYSFSLADVELALSGLQVDQALSESQIRDYQNQSEQGKAFASAVRYIDVRPRSHYEVVSYLRRKGYGEEDIQAVVGRLEQVSLIDDVQFAATWIAGRQALRPRSRRMLEQELLAKGLKREVVSVALSNLADEDELLALDNLISKKRRLPQYQDDQKLVGYLIRQGYAMDLIKKALKAP